MSYHRREFDDYIDFYRQAQERAIAISGEREDYFACLRAVRLKTWLPELAAGRPRILDFGCSDGLMAAIMAEIFPGAEISGVDSSQRSIDYAKRSHPELEFIWLEKETLPFVPNGFDFVYAVGVFHHVPFIEHERVYSEIFRVIKPGGAFVLFEMNPWNPVTQLVFARSAVDRKALMFSSRYAQKCLRPFGRMETHYYAYFPRWLSWLRWLEPYLEKIPLGTLYAVIIRKDA